PPRTLWEGFTLPPRPPCWAGGACHRPGPSPGGGVHTPRPPTPHGSRGRQADGELGAAADLALDVDGAPVGLDDLARRRQAEAGAARPGGVEGAERLGAHLGPHALAGA